MNRRHYLKETRQTVLPEWNNPNLDPSDAFPFYVSQHIVDDAPGERRHLAHEEDMMGDIGTTYCGRWQVKAVSVHEGYVALSAARNLCYFCLKQLEPHELEMLAALASEHSQHEITADDIENDE